MPVRRRRTQFRQTDEFTRGFIVGLRTAGWSLRRIAQETQRDATTVGRIWRRWSQEGNVQRRRGTGARRRTSERTDRRIRRHAVAEPQSTTGDILRSVQGTLDAPISTRTVSRRWAAAGLLSSRPWRRLPLTSSHRRHRLEWCRTRAAWGAEWNSVVFSDESRFCLTNDDGRVRVWRRRGHRTDPSAILERHTARQRGVMVWGAISVNSRSPLLRITGTLTARRYVDEVLRPVALPYLQGIPNAIFQQDNARPHTARISLNALQGVRMLPWPARSPDLSPMENLWDTIGRGMNTLPPPRNEDELWTRINSTWSTIPQDIIRTLIESMPRRVQRCIAQNGGPTTY